MSNYSRIAKNTIFLYLRMIIAMFVGLYTSRVLLQALGAEDYGIYNIVGGFVAMFSLVSSTLTSAISRFLTFELGKGDMAQLKKVFATSILVLIGLSLIVLLLGETVGLWFLKNKLVIPSYRVDAAFWVYQLALAVFVINLLTIPFSASVISHERMDTYAYISLFEVFCKLGICFAIIHSPIDRLVFYAILLCCVSILVTVFYVIYCRRNFPESRTGFRFEFKLLKNMFGFAGWNFIGSAGWILRNQGGTVLLNLFGGPVVNAAHAIAYSLSGLANNFATCFTTSFNPQITKQYASNQFEELHKLLIYGSKFSFFLLYLVALPLLLNTAFVLDIWLGDVPAHTITFVRLLLIIALLDIISIPLMTVKNATGRIRNYQLIVGGIQLLSIPLGYLGLKLGAPVEWMYVAFIIVSVLCLVARVKMLDGDIPLWSGNKFFKEVVLRIAVVALLAAIIPIIVYSSLPYGWLNLVVTSACSLVSNMVVIYSIGLNRQERTFLKSKCRQILCKLNNKWARKISRY